MAVTEKEVRDVLQEIHDPEIHMSIMDLGLVYGVDVAPSEETKEKVKVDVKTTLTTPSCPYGPAILSKIHQDVSAIDGVGEVNVDLVWVPPWDPRTMATAEVKLKMGIIEFEDDEDEEDADNKE